ncbi:hypothetical protein ACWF95_40230 [Streptomyces vinaceus]
MAAAKALAQILDLPALNIDTALKTLDTLGEIHLRKGAPAADGPLVLAPQDPHPDDIALSSAVHHRIHTGHYTAGQALPTGLLSTEFALRPEHADRALRHLTRTGLIHYNPHGPHGPAYYVAPRTSENSA